MKKFNSNEENENINNNEDTGNGTENTNEENGIAPAMIDGPIIWPADPVDPNDPRLPSNTYSRIALFQCGLDGNPDSLAETINKMDQSEVCYEVVPFIINMTNCDVDGSFRSDTDQEIFDESIYQVVLAARESNNSKIVLVRTCLSNKFDNVSCPFDSVENQKNKLKKIIDALWSYENIRIYLVGHSQGGIVNMEAAIACPGKVYKMISISTAYAPVYLGNAFLLLNLYSLGVISLIYQSNNAIEFISAATVLSSNLYYSDLLSRWQALWPRPELYVITGSIGRIKTNLGLSNTPATCSVEAFDGLVRTCEQKAVSPVTEYFNFVSDLASCAIGETGNYCPDCQLEILTLNEALFATGITALEATWDYINGEIESLPELSQLPLLQAIRGGIENSKRDNPLPFTDSCNSEFNSYELCKDFYDVFSCKFNHDAIRYCDETINTLCNLIALWD